MIARTVALLGLALACALPAAASDDFTIPPTPDHYVTDNAGALSASTRAALENQLHAYETSTGHQIVVWIGNTTGGVPLETWTTQTADRWKIGRKGHDDGAVLFLFMQDHKARIEVGYGLEGNLTDADAHRIIADVVVPRMRAGDTDAAVAGAVDAMLATITPSYKGSPLPAQPSAPSAAVIPLAIGLIVMLVVIFIIIVQVIGSLRYGYLIMREGSAAARRDMRGWWFASGVVSGASSSGFSSGGGDFGGGGGFSAGGGGFGGGGASGGW